MRRLLIMFFISMILSLNTKAAYVQINNLSGTATYGTLTATVTSTGSVTTWLSWCTTSFGTSYWAGNGLAGSYNFVFNHPVYSVKILSYADNGGPLGAGEYVQTSINGSVYPLTAANMTSYTDCGGVGSGPTYLLGGLLYGPVGTLSDYNGGDFIITSCAGINSFNFYCNGIGNGVTFYMWVDTTFACYNATNNGPLCYGDSLKLHVIGGDTTLPYTWFGPGGYTTTGRNPIIPNTTFADSGTYFVVQVLAGGVHDTAWTHVVINPKPVITASNNSPLCPSSGLPLDLFSTPFVAGETFSWTGPGGYTSTLQNPVVSPFVATDTGTFTVIVNLNGCKDTATTHVRMVCFTATNNGPVCLGDTLKLYAQGGDSTQPYVWYTPTGYLATGQYPVVNVSSFSDSGMVYSVQIIGGVHDTAWTHVIIKPLPVVTATSNSPICGNPGNPLDLFAAPYTVGETFSWTGPLGYSSTLENPTYPGFSISDTGIYMVYTTLNGCKDSGQTHVVITPVPPAPGITGKSPYCYNDPFIPFTVTSEPGSTLNWYTVSVGGVGSTTALTINTTLPGNTTYWITQSILGCESPRDSITVTVLPQIIPAFTYGIHRGCTMDTVYFNNTSTGGTYFRWLFGDNSTGYSTDPVHTYPASFPFKPPYCFSGSVTLFDSNGYCVQSVTIPINTSHPILAAYQVIPDTICLGGSTTLTDASSGGGLSYFWNFGDGLGSTVTGTVTHTYNTPGVITSKLIITDSISCQDSAVANVYVLDYKIHSFHDTTLCLTRPLLINTSDIVNIQGDYTFAHLWSPAVNLTSYTDQSTYFSGFGTYQYILTDTLKPYGCIAYDTVNIKSILGAVLTNVNTTSTILLGGSIQLNADNEVFYYWTPDDGTLDNPNINNPIATPSKTTTYIVYGRDIYGCLDSARVLVIVDSTVVEFFPTGFSPNGDGLNDVLRPVGLTFQKLIEFRVFNRWGQQVFYSTDKEKGWDGTFNGIPQDIGTYYYMVIYQRPGDAENVIHKGEVTLIR